jgi:hypothetical protein
MSAARKVWEALGVEERMGFSQVGNHSHCVFPDDQEADLTAFLERFLVGEVGVETDVFRTVNETFDEGMWIDWSVPKLY